MQSRWLIIVLIVILLAAALIVGVWWFAENEDQLDADTTPVTIVSALDVWYMIR